MCLLAILLLGGCSSAEKRAKRNEEVGAAPYEALMKASGGDSLGNPNPPNTTVSGRDRYAAFLIERAEAALQAGQYTEASRLFNQLGRVPGYESRGQEGAARVPLRPASTTSCSPTDPKALVQVCQRLSTNEPDAPVSPGDTALGRTILLETSSQPAQAAVSPGNAAPAASASAPAAQILPVEKNAVPVAVAESPAKSANAAGPADKPAAKPAVSRTDDPFKKRVTLEFRDASVRSLFDAITQASGLNVIFDRDISPDLKTTVYLRNTTIKAALDKIVLTSGLAWRNLDENTLLVYMDDANKQHDYQALTIRSFQLSNADAKFVANSLKTVLKFRELIVDEKLNMIVVRDTPEAIAMAEKLVAMHDVAEPEVMLEVTILEVNKGKLQNLGVAWPGSMSLAPLARTVTSTANSTTDLTTGLSSSTTSNVLTLRDLWNLTPGSLTMGLGATTLNFNATDSDINVLANPRIRTRNREKAKIMIGERVPQLASNTTSTGVIAQNVTYIDVGIKLDVEPQIYPGNEVGLKIALEVSSINGTEKSGTTVAYRIGTRNATTMLRLKDGENQVLAGLIQDSDKKSVNKVPLLGDIPILGRLFRSDSDDKAKTELVLSITPRLIRGNQRFSPEAASFDAGTYSSVRGRRGEGSDPGVSVEPGNSPQPVQVSQPTDPLRQAGESGSRMFGGSRD
ncbi:secretin N-terminal domain-containing protein [Uliginosibacterium sp. 31-16]|uniref:secretin N-terminal domain-containing protein n=1 Tax=Uliginosibacterium sp. 31-16 TaxID=3068315 RepID=UPI00273EC3C2|nr:secretin N-terminal domain-containing protein [Uliginosibacterium sp. 31-16]MDP5239615.1 secretin N-terminal domain-containing protein [Uliginosibacterium sp. 31-16]